MDPRRVGRCQRDPDAPPLRLLDRAGQIKRPALCHQGSAARDGTQHGATPHQPRCLGEFRAVFKRKHPAAQHDRAGQPQRWFADVHRVSVQIQPAVLRHDQVPRQQSLRSRPVHAVYARVLEGDPAWRLAAQGQSAKSEVGVIAPCGPTGDFEPDRFVAGHDHQMQIAQPAHRLRSLRDDIDTCSAKPDGASRHSRHRRVLIEDQLPMHVDLDGWGKDVQLTPAPGPEHQVVNPQQTVVQFEHATAEVADA